MILSPFAMITTGVVLGAWTLGAAWAVLVARRRTARAEAAVRLARRLGRMIEDSPALPMVVRSDGRIEGPARLAQWFGFDALPGYLSELDGGNDAGLGNRGFDEYQLSQLSDAIRRTQKTGAPAHLALALRGRASNGARRALGVHVVSADPQISPAGAALVWFFDFSESEAELDRLRGQTARALADFAGLSGLIEAAPLPMWFRGPDLALRLVNHAYVRAVGARSAADVVAQGIELIETADGQTPRDVARAVLNRRLASDRVISATIGGQRRAMRVTDLPLGDDGVAGYAVDIEDMEELTRQFRRFRAAQRQMLDTMSAAIAQFDERRSLVFVNQPFLRQFGVTQAFAAENPPFDRVLDRMRDGGRLPEVRDFPEWRRERQGWFLSREAREEPWLLSDGTHLRVVAQPMPDGGLLMIFEDRTEQLQLAAMRDTLLRTRTATFDNLFESLAVFGPDSRLQLWNRRFAADWGLDDELLAGHPRAEVILTRIAKRLRRPAQVSTVAQVIEAATLERRQHTGRLALADGRHLAFAGVPLPDGNGLLTVLDITDSQKAETMLRERNAALVEADAVKTRFIANMSYEFRTPLTSIRGFAEMLQAGLAGELGAQANDYVAAILASVERLGEQIETVLDLSQGEAGTLPVARDAVPLFGLLTQIVGEREAALAEAGLTLDLRGTDAIGTVTGDALRLRRAFGHLLDNAITATPAGGRILIEARRRPDRKVEVTVSDTGRGMEPAQLARAIEGLPAHPEAGAERRGGLGLPLVRRLIAAHGGTIDLASEPGQGTRATVVLP